MDKFFSKRELQIMLDYVNEMITLFKEDNLIYNKDMSIKFEEYEFLILKTKLMRILL